MVALTTKQGKVSSCVFVCDFGVVVLVVVVVVAVVVVVVVVVVALF